MSPSGIKHLADRDRLAPIVARVLCFTPDDHQNGWAARMVNDPPRWKCGYCGFGVVLTYVQGIPDYRVKCRRCGALVVTYLEDGRRISSSAWKEKP